MKPGDRLVGGTVCKVTDEGSVYLGREAKQNEECPSEHSEHKFDGGRRAFLSDAQGPHNTAQHGALLKPAKAGK